MGSARGGRNETYARWLVSFRFVSFSFFLSFSRTSFDLFHADESGVALSFSLLLSPLFHRARARDYFLWAGTLSVSASEGKKYSGIETNSFSYVPTRWPCIYMYIICICTFCSTVSTRSSSPLSVPSLLRRTFKLERETLVPRHAVSDSRSRGATREESPGPRVWCGDKCREGRSGKRCFDR